jgi:GDPmannose 4,6-dehydratase
VVDHLQALLDSGSRTPLSVGNLTAQRDWGFAPDYVDGMVLILRQAAVRSVSDEPSEYRDYVLGTGRLHTVWELIGRAFELAGFELEWALEGDDPLAWSASFADTGELAVGVDPAFVRPTDPRAIVANPARIRDELGWEPRVGLDAFLLDMLENEPPAR